MARRDRGERSPELRPRVSLRGVTAASLSARTRGLLGDLGSPAVRRTLIAITPLTLLVPLLGVVGGVIGGGAGAAAAPCESDATPTYAGEIPTGDEVEASGFDDRQLRRPPPPRSRTTSTRSTRPATTSARILRHHVQGRPLTYAIVGSPGRRGGREARLAPPPEPAIPTRRDGRTDCRAAARRSSGWPATCTATRRAAATRALHVLHELTDRTDCAATTIRDNTVTVIIPTQNPDGREARHSAATPTASTSTATGSPAPRPRRTASWSCCGRTRPC